MRAATAVSGLLRTLISLVIGIIGAALAWLLSAPIFMLLGPAIAVSAAGIAGVRTAVHPRVRDASFLLLGVAVGGGFDSDALAAMIRWPFAFLVMAICIWVILVLCRRILVRIFAFDDRGAVLAAAPGHLSFVLATAAEGGTDLARISVSQSVRLLSLTIAVPFVAMALGVEVAGNVAPTGVPLPLFHIAGLLLLGLLLGLVFLRLSVPAPLLMGTMVTSAIGHLSGLTPGVMPEWLILPAYLVLGTLIGTRFSGLGLRDLRQGLAAGLVVTGIAASCAALAAIPVAIALGMPAAHVLVAFAPGGLETMIAMGAVLGVVPGFVAACHIARLVVLTFLLPWMLRR